MVCEVFCERDSFVHNLDPRGRIVIAAAFSVLIALSTRILVPAAGLLLSMILAALAELPVRATLKRLAAVNVFILVVVVLLPITTAGSVLVSLGPVSYSREGLQHSLQIALKSNAIVLASTALMSTIEVTTLGHALGHLRVPQKLVQLFLLTVRYIDVLRHEHLRLARAMKVRCFRPRMNAHTFRSIGYLVGMLVVKSFERSERVAAAMKCRGFQGRFYVLSHFTAARRDIAFCAVSLLALFVLAWVEWS